MSRKLNSSIFRLSLKSYYFGIVVVVGWGLLLRFWQLSRFNTLVFDEIYFVNFAKAYLAGTPQFDAHPPMGKYFIALGIWLSSHIPSVSGLFANDINPEIGFSSLSYRWMNALIGGLVPLVVMGIVSSLSNDVWPWSSEKQKTRCLRSASPEALTQKWAFSLLAGAFIATDGLFVTESRYALINVYMVFFGLLGHWLWLQAKHRMEETQTFRDLVLCGLASISLGVSVAVKWNGLGFLLGLFIWEYWQIYSLTDRLKLTRAQVSSGLFYGILVPGFSYVLIWWPHLVATGEHFTDINVLLLHFHQQLGAAGHVACSKWYTWPLLIKPFPYWYEEVETTVRAVSNMGNPLLWWLSSAAILLLSVDRICRVTNRRAQGNAKPLVVTRLSSYLLINYFVNWLPWSGVNRCTYLYHYMPAAVFAFITVAWLMSRWLCSSEKYSRIVAWMMLGAIAIAFYFWIPLNLGSPLTPEALRMRWWLRSWI